MLGAAAGVPLALGGCRASLPTAAAESSEGFGPCYELARTFATAAENRDRGASRESQTAAAYATAEDPKTADPNGTLRYLLQTVDFVYGRPDVTADEIEAQVLAGCLVNDDGRAVLYLPDP
jgi:hypothetical protein